MWSWPWSQWRSPWCNTWISSICNTITESSSCLTRSAWMWAAAEKWTWCRGSNRKCAWSCMKNCLRERKRRRKSSKLYFLKTNSAKVRKNAEREYKLNMDDGWRSTAFFSSFVKSWPFFSSVLIVKSCSWEKNYKIFFRGKLQNSLSETALNFWKVQFNLLGCNQCEQGRKEKII